MRGLIDPSRVSLGEMTALGAGYGLVLWLVAAAVVMPIWMMPWAYRPPTCRI